MITLLLMATTHKKLNTPHYMPKRARTRGDHAAVLLMMIGGIYNNMYMRRFRKTMLPQIGRFVGDGRVYVRQRVSSAACVCAHVCVYINAGAGSIKFGPFAVNELCRERRCAKLLN